MQDFWTDLEKRMHALSANERILIAIEGPCAAGKSSLAREMAKKYPGNIFHMDDFFLQNTQRSQERLREKGGNIDYERFKSEVLTPLLEGKEFSYRPYDCKKQRLLESVYVKPAKINIIEGVYSMHSFFGEIYDVCIYIDIASALQKERIKKRPAKLQQRFFDEWIPKENEYFQFFNIKARCEMIIENNKYVIKA